MSGDWTLDASAGRVRMNPTRIYGFVKQASTGSLTLQLDSIQGRRVSAFNFAGTGKSPAQDADPANYEVTTGALDLSALGNVNPPSSSVSRRPSAWRRRISMRARWVDFAVDARHDDPGLGRERHDRTVQQPRAHRAGGGHQQSEYRPAACAHSSVRACST